jgi:signal transduction histidine kinase
MRIVAGTGERMHLVGRSFPFEGSAAATLMRTGRRSLGAAADEFPYLNDELFDGPPTRLAVALTGWDGQGEGALYVIRDTPLRPDEVDVLELLGASAGAALRSAGRYASAVAERREKDAVIDAMADGLAVLDGSGSVRNWNRALAAMTGVAAEDVIGRYVPFPLPDVGAVLEHELPNGRWIDVNVAAVDGSRDLVVGVRDVSRTKAVEAAKDLFLATSSHELRTPLTVLRGFAETLLNHWDTLGDDRRREIVATMLVRTNAMTELIEQLLLGSQARAGVDVRVRAFDLAAVVRSAAGTIAGSQPSHPLRLDAAGTVRALGDESTIDAVLGQLVENAVKYSPSGGVIDISVGEAEGSALLQVADVGVGIPEEDLERVFEQFVRSDSGAAVGATGAGLGLWIVRRYVSAQGGQVRARRRAGGGTVIEVRLPLA